MSPRSLARRSLQRNATAVTSVATAPVTSKATTIVVALGNELPGQLRVQRSSAADRARVRPGRAPAGRPRATTSAGRPARAPGPAAGRTDSGKTAPETRNSAPGDRLRVGPRLLAGLQADRGEDDPDRDDRDEPEGHDHDQQRPVDDRPDRTGRPRTSTPMASVIAAPIAPTRDPGRAPTEQDDQRSRSG